MYQFSRAIYRQVAEDILEGEDPRPGLPTNHERVLRACEAALERLAYDRHYFARPARTLFCDIRMYFPMAAQERVYMVIRRYLAWADDYLARQPKTGFDVNGNPLSCRATTRKGTPCQRVPLPHNGYCPSHQHLAETEDFDVQTIAA
jgi:hypothetical protein